MRLSNFIIENQERISQDWNALVATSKSDQPGLRDHIGLILLEIAADIETPQSERICRDNSLGHDDGNDRQVLGTGHLNIIEHTAQRFSIDQLAADLRALRSTVLELWFEHVGADPDQATLRQVIRFNGAIDQVLAESVERITREIQDSRDLFLAILSHDLRNPLGAIRNFTEVLRQMPNLSPEKVHVLADRIIGGVDRITNMVNGLLDVARTRFGNSLPMTRAPMELEQLCREIVSEALIANPGVSIKFNCKGNLSGIWDRVRLSQVISNLLGNAIEHGERKGLITLTAVDEGPLVRVAVHNEGPPIPAGIKPSIFKEFVRAPRPEAGLKASAGLGLGLYIAWQIAVAHGGAIEVDSSEAGGTIFTLRLPRDVGSLSPGSIAAP